MPDNAAFWDKKAQGYARRPVADNATYEKKLAETREFLQPHMHILEFGCGTGTTAVHHAPHVAHVDAIDIAENMLQIGRQRATEAGVTNITFSRGTLAEFAAQDASLDAVLGLNVLHLLPDRTETLAEVARILKPGGIFVSSTACLAGSKLRFIKLIAPLAKWLGLMPDVFVFSEDEYTAEVSAAGFAIERQWHHGTDDISVFMIARKI
ncbi:MAG: class I SAM-dependent methyltransferase [Pseudomonadales bacterium]